MGDLYYKLIDTKCFSVSMTFDIFLEFIPLNQLKLVTRSLSEDLLYRKYFTLLEKTFCVLDLNTDYLTCSLIFLGSALVFALNPCVHLHIRYRNIHL